MQKPTDGDLRAASQVGEYIATGYGKFDDRHVVQRTGKGKIYGIVPVAGSRPMIKLYEVTSPEDIAQIERLARQALVQFPQVEAISLHFYTSQNVTFSPEGGMTRGHESAFRKVTVERAERRGAA